MSINKIQFQKGMTLVEFIKIFPNEKSCRDLLRKEKWPEGFCCRRCSCRKSSIQRRGIREVHECLSCFYQESLIANTLFEHSRLPLQSWFLAIQLLTQAKTCMSAMELHRHLNVNIKTAQLLKHKIMQTLSDSEKSRLLKGRVECESAYLSGIPKDSTDLQKRVKRVPFVAAVQTDKSHHPQKVVLTQLSELSRDQLKNWGEKHLGSGVVVISKSLDYFHGIDSLCKHRSYELSKKNLASIEFELKWVRIVLVNVKAAFTGAIHAFDFRKYGHRYLGNMQFRFNHRFDLKNCFYEVLHCAVKAQAKPRRVLFSDIYG